MVGEMRERERESDKERKVRIRWPMASNRLVLFTSSVRVLIRRLKKVTTRKKVNDSGRNVGLQL